LLWQLIKSGEREGEKEEERKKKKKLVLASTSQNYITVSKAQETKKMYNSLTTHWKLKIH
jgi:hypothetical protein